MTRVQAHNALLCCESINRAIDCSSHWRPPTETRAGSETPELARLVYLSRVIVGDTISSDRHDGGAVDRDFKVGLRRILVFLSRVFGVDIVQLWYN